MRTRCTLQLEEFIRVRFYRERCLPLRVPGESAPTIPVAAVSQASRNFFLAFSSPLVDPSFFLEFLLLLSRPNFSFFFFPNKTRRNRVVDPRVSSNGTRPNYPPSFRRVPPFRPFPRLLPEIKLVVITPFVITVACATAV